MESKLAIHGGSPAIKDPLPPMFPGGMRIGKEEEEQILEIIRSKRLYRYTAPDGAVPSKVAQFEKEFANHMGVKYAVAVNSGTASLLCSLAAVGIGIGDEVIVPGYTWIATASAVVAMGAVPIFAEVDSSLTLDPEDFQKKITQYTKAVMVVHMRGAPANVDRIIEIAKKYNIKVIEDTAQADGASFKGRRLGTIGDVGAFSFQFNKILTAGEGGMVITNNEQIWRRAAMYQDTIGGYRALGKGITVPPEEMIMGVSCRMSELQGACALAQLPKLELLLADMRRNKNVLIRKLDALLQKHEGKIKYRLENDQEGEAAICLVIFFPTSRHAEQVTAALVAENVIGTYQMYSETKVDCHVYCYFEPIMRQQTYSINGNNPWTLHKRQIKYDRKGDCPKTLDLLGRAVHIDISPDLTDHQIDEMSEAIHKVVNYYLQD